MHIIKEYYILNVKQSKFQKIETRITAISTLNRKFK